MTDCAVYLITGVYSVIFMLHDTIKSSNNLTYLISVLNVTDVAVTRDQGMLAMKHSVFHPNLSYFIVLPLRTHSCEYHFHLAQLFSRICKKK